MEYNRRLLYTVSLNHFTNDGATTLIASLFPIMLGLFHLNYIQVGVLVAIGLLTNVVVQPLVGKFADRISSEKLMMAGMSLILVSLLFLAVAIDFYEILLVTIFLRFGSSFFHPVGMSSVSKTFKTGADNAMGFMVAFGNFGVFASFIVGAYVYNAFGWGWPFYLWAAITAATALLTLSQLRETRSHLRNILSQPATTGAASPRRSSYRAMLSRAAMLLVFSSAVLSSGYAVFTSFGNLTLVGRGLDVASSNLGVALFAGTAIVGAYSLGRLRRSFSNASLLATTTVLSIFSYVGMVVIGSPSLDLPLFLVAGISGSIGGTATLAMAGDFVEADVLGSFFGILFALQTLGSAAVSAASGIAAQFYGLGAPYLIMTLLSVPVVVWSISIRGKSRVVTRAKTVIASVP